jgi:putative ABC transport system permease protein
MLDLHPIVAALRRNARGALLIGLQIALTLAILCNALFIIHQRLAELARASGIDESDLFIIANDWIGGSDAAARVRGDLAALRALPGVRGAYVTNAYPLSDSGWSTGLYLRDPGQGPPNARTAEYFADEQTLHTLGLTLIAGRNFNATEIVDRTRYSKPAPAALIITQALARRLFPDGSALGKRVFFQSQTRTTPIIGVVAKLQTPWVAGEFGRDFIDNSMLVPYRYVDGSAYYMVRAAPGALAAVMKRATQRLMQLDANRVIQKVQPLTEARKEVYRDARSLAIILAVVCALLLAVTACGIVGLTSYWVAQRRRQIGVRRALGATRPAILRYFQVENLLISTVAGLAGTLLGIATNLWMVQHLQMTRMPVLYPLVGLGGVVLLGQLAVLWPALRAAAIAPALAAQNV